MKSLQTKALTSILILLSVSIQLQSQEVKVPGYIISMSSDTIQGYFESQLDRKSSQKCVFSKEENGGFIEYKPTEIKGYRIGEGKFYVSKVINIDGKEQIVFLEFLIKGKANFYFYKDFTEHYFIEKEGSDQLVVLTEPEKDYGYGEIGTVGLSKYKGQLIYILSDWKKAEDEVSDAILSHKSLIKLGKKYHESICNDESCIIFERPVSAVKYKLSLNGGMNSSFLKFGEKLRTRHTHGYSAGVELEFKQVTNSDHNFSYSAGVYFLRINKATLWNHSGSYNRLFIIVEDETYYLTERDYGSVITPSVSELDVELDYLGIRVPIYLNYRFGKSRLQPLVGAGVSFMHTIQKSEKFRYPYFEYSIGKTFPDFYIGYQARIGFQYKINDRFNGFTSFNYDFCANPKVNAIDKLKFNSFGVNLGFQF